MDDLFNRKIDYLRISVTDRCNLRCFYCMPECGIEKTRHDDIASFEELYEMARACTELGVHKIRVTGGEPLVRLGVLDFLKEVRRPSRRRHPVHHRKTVRFCRSAPGSSKKPASIG